MVAIIGNDAVLDAAPATPVQLAHACLRRGFTVAVPASWGDELVATETVRRLALRERGPAVMCVCPFVRSRLLAPGPDLAPFLVSLVAPPVATARYLRAAYAEHGVHITYIGSCPSADDPSIDERLTPDAFLADLADHGIALAEQPLVFDSIVPPDRRRWCSLPGGTPTAEVLWADSDMRTLVEIDRDDVSTDLAQHIITHEHALLDLAPGLGCACSGAIRSSPARTARTAVTAVEPPRALKPIIDPAPTISLDAPVGEHVTSPVLSVVGPVAPTAEESSESRLDELLGSPIDRPWGHSDPEADIAVGFTVEAAMSGDVAGHTMDRVATATLVGGQGRSDIAPAAELSPERPATPGGLAEGLSEHVATPPTVPEAEPTPVTASPPETAAEPPAPTTTGRTHVRRHTPPRMPVRYPTSAIPRATGSDGKALPRAYAAKRRTPSAGALSVDENAGAGVAETSSGEGPHGSAPPTSLTPPAAVTDLQTTVVTDLETASQPPAANDPSLAAENSETATEQPPVDTPADASQTGEPAAATAEPTPAEKSGRTPGADQSSQSESDATAGAAIDSNTSAGLLVALLIALLAIGFFILRALK